VCVIALDKTLTNKTEQNRMQCSLY